MAQHPVYKLGDCIGKGAMGKVFKGFNSVTGDMCAIKQIQTTHLTPKQLAKATAEGDLLLHLDHPNILRIFDRYTQGKHMYLVLEYMESGSLGNIVRKYGAFSETLVRGYVIQILSGLHYLHTQGVIHRDIKGANALVTKDGVVKLADFGEVSLPAYGTVAGSPHWMSPEVILEGDVSFAADIWSVGCTIVELLTAKPPYASLGAMPTMYKMVEEPHPPLPENISTVLRDFLLLCFARNPLNRPSAMQLLHHSWIAGDMADVGIRKRSDSSSSSTSYQSTSKYNATEKEGLSGGVVTILRERQRRDSEVKRPNLVLTTTTVREDTDSISSQNASDDTMDSTVSEGGIFEMEPPTNKFRSGSSESSLGSQLARLNLDDVDDAIYGAIDRQIGNPATLNPSISSFHLQATYSPRGGIDDHFMALSEMEISKIEDVEEARSNERDRSRRHEKKYERVLGITSKDMEQPQEDKRQKRKSWRDRDLYIDTPRDIDIKSREIKELHMDRKNSKESDKDRERREKDLYKEFEKHHKSKERKGREQKEHKNNEDGTVDLERKSRHHRRSVDNKSTKSKDREREKEQKEEEKDRKHRTKGGSKLKLRDLEKKEWNSDSDSNGGRSRSSSRSRVHSPAASPPSSPRKSRPVDFINVLRAPKLDDVRPLESSFANPPLSPRSRNNSMESKIEGIPEGRERSKSRTATIGDTTAARKESVGESSKPKLKKQSSNEGEESTGKSFFSRFSLSKNKDEPSSPRGKLSETSDDETQQTRASISAPSSPLARTSSTRPLSPKRPTSPKFTLAFPSKFFSTFSSKLTTTPSSAVITKPPSPPSSPTLSTGHLPDPPPLHLDGLDSSPSPRRRRNTTREDALATFLDISATHTLLPSPRSAPSSFNPHNNQQENPELKSLSRKSESDTKYPSRYSYNGRLESKSADISPRRDTNPLRSSNERNVSPLLSSSRGSPEGLHKARSSERIVMPNGIGEGAPTTLRERVIVKENSRGNIGLDLQRTKHYRHLPKYRSAEELHNSGNWEEEQFEEVQKKLKLHLQAQMDSPTCKRRSTCSETDLSIYHQDYLKYASGDDKGKHRRRTLKLETSR